MSRKWGDGLSPRTGRPPKENARNVSLGLRLTVDEAHLLQECAEKLNITRTDVIVKGVQMVKSEIEKKK